MAFIITGGVDGNRGGDRQRINLSRYAWDIIETDMMQFGFEKTGTFLNLVFSNYHDDAAASISKRIEAYQKEIKGILKDNASDFIIESFTRHREDQLKKAVKDYPNGEGINIRLNNRNYDYLTEDCNEDRYYEKHKAGKYLKAVLEEYARLPDPEREEVVFRDRIRIIEDAIRAKETLKMTVDHGRGPERWIVSPFKVARGATNVHLYLFCSYRLASENGSQWKKNSPRISFIQGEIERLSEPSVFADRQKEEEFKKEIEGRDPVFLYQENSRIRVRLTRNGIRMYRTLPQLRPKYVAWDGNVLTFDCTLKNAEYFFFKFGYEAEILEPEELRNVFRDYFTKALRLYDAKE